MRKYILFILICCASLAAAQSPTVNQMHRINALTLETIRNLETYSYMSDNNSKNRFRRLFVRDDNNKRVLCDIFSDQRYLTNISIKEYVEIVSEHTSGLEIEFRSLQSMSLEYYGAGWRYQLRFIKYMTYYNSDGLGLPKKENEEPISIMITLVIDDELQSCKIDRIDIAPGYRYDRNKEDWVIVQQNRGKGLARIEDDVTVKGEPLRYNNYHQVWLNSPVFEHKDSDVEITTDEIASTDLYSLVQLRFHSRHGRLRVRNEISPLGYAVSAPANFSKISSFAYTVGLDMGVAFPLGRHCKMGLFTGVGVVLSKLSLQVDSMKYNIEMSAPSGKNYARQYELFRANQQASFTDLMIPAYLNLDFPLSNRVSFVADLGAKIYFNTITKVTPMRLSGKVTGPVGTESILLTNKEYNHYLFAATYVRNPIDISVFGYAGVNVRLYKNILFLDARVGYEHGLTKTNVSTKSTFFDATEGFYPLVYAASLGEDVLTQPLANCISYSRQSIWFNIGLMLKF